MAGRERMSSVDRAWLMMDDPTNPMVINGFWIFEEPLQYEQALAVLEERLLIHERFRQRVVERRGALRTRAYWEVDPAFDLRAHVGRIVLPPPGDRKALNDTVARLLTAPLALDRPLWTFTLIEGYGGGSVFFGRIHHCIGDGAALVRVLLSLTDGSAEGARRAPAAASPILSEAGLVMISSSNTSPSLTSDLRGNAGANYHAGYYRVSSNDLHQAEAVAEFVYSELGLRRMATIHDGDPYTTGLTGAFAIAFEALGGTVTAVAEVSRGDTDMAPVLTRIAADSPEGIFFPLFPDEAGYVVRQIGEVDGLEGLALINSESLLFTELESVDAYLSGPEFDFGGNVNEATGRSGDSLFAAYQQKYHESANYAYMALAYDATTILLRAIEETAVADGDTLYIDRAKLRETLTSTTDFDGIIGSISCDSFGDCGTGLIHISHYTDPTVNDIAELPVVFRYAP